MVDRRTQDFARPDASHVGSLGIILRAVFLACSWTWCLGMFFPTYMIADFGFWGWVAFVVPNVIGAGAMGTVLNSVRSSENMVSRHTPAMRWFSIATVAFHLYFLSAFFGAIYTSAAGPLIGVAALFTGLLLAAMPLRGWWATGPAVYIISAVAAGLAWLSEGAALTLPPIGGRHGPLELAFTLPVLIFGFALCPYLDLTFHRVRRETPGAAGARAFWIGFVVFFLPLVTLTMLYRDRIGGWITVHIAVQSAFTIGAHFRELLIVGPLRRPDEFAPPSARRSALVAAALLALAAIPLAGVLINQLGLFREAYSWRRLGYESFMSLYGLVFPAYVWIVVIERGMPRPTRLALFAASVVAASPCFWLGYIEQHYIWLIPGVALPVSLPLLWLLIRGRPAL
jgi:hypothetical protein